MPIIDSDFGAEKPPRWIKGENGRLVLNEPRNLPLRSMRQKKMRALQTRYFLRVTFWIGVVVAGIVGIFVWWALQYPYRMLP
jgi:hypothetical protein